MASLLKKSEYKWSEKCDEAFNELKHCLLADPILQYLDLNHEFVLTTDASNYALGAVLSQKINNFEKPVAYTSRTMNDAIQ